MHPESETAPVITSPERLDDSASEDAHRRAQNTSDGGLFKRLKNLFTQSAPENTDEALREAIEEYIVEPQSFNADSVSTHERILFSNILKIRDIAVVDVMIPRADIAAIDVDISRDDLLKLLSKQHFSRFPLYKDSLDDVMGTVHIKDIMGAIAQDRDINLKDMITEIPIVSPTLPMLDLVLKMRHTRRHMALVVDEYGGIDGLVTIGDVIETIIGDIEDEHDKQEDPQMIETDEGTIMADARVEIDDFEKKYGRILDEEEREESHTLGGLVFDLAGRVPVRGEVITHASGMVFEILEADPRRIFSLKITNIPKASKIADAGD